MKKWTIDDQVSLTGRNGKYAYARALAKYNRLKARAVREARRSTEAHAKWVACERTDCVPVSAGSNGEHAHDEAFA